MKSKTDEIQEREDDACGTRLFFDNVEDIGSKNSVKRGHSHRKSIIKIYKRDQPTPKDIKEKKKKKFFLSAEDKES